MAPGLRKAGLFAADTSTYSCGELAGDNGFRIRSGWTQWNPFSASLARLDKWTRV